MLQRSVYFADEPRDRSTGYFASFASIFLAIAAMTSIPVTSAKFKT